MKITKKFHCQPLTLNRLNLWLWTTALLLLGLVFQLEMSGSVSWVAVLFFIIYLALTIYLLMSSYFRIDLVARRLDLHFPFSRQAFELPLSAFTTFDFSKRTVKAQTAKGQVYHLLLSHKTVLQLQQLVAQEGQASS
ncbi:EbsA family protein [Lapidilactobacillus luobeiensis]|uniref:EbsA family protein n=1 Tax=Lapidilactobacillus luobeiensis TaxID=2950371 RepID=UPI0021C2BF0A|nr:EbsA family protein [Lapidilactobacillus luobeiensis]